MQPSNLVSISDMNIVFENFGTRSIQQLCNAKRFLLEGYGHTFITSDTLTTLDQIEIMQEIRKYEATFAM